MGQFTASRRPCLRFASAVAWSVAVLLCAAHPLGARNRAPSNKIFYYEPSRYAPRPGVAFAQQIPRHARALRQPNPSSLDAAGANACHLWLKTLLRCADLGAMTPENRFVHALLVAPSKTNRADLEPALNAAGVPIVENVPAIVIVAPPPRGDLWRSLGSGSLGLMFLP